MARHFSVVFGARPGGAFLGQPGTPVVAFAVSGLVHIVGPAWAAVRVTESLHEGGIHLPMGLGVILESKFGGAIGLGWIWRKASVICCVKVQ